jgi:hypothetical protein
LQSQLVSSIWRCQLRSLWALSTGFSPRTSSFMSNSLY